MPGAHARPPRRSFPKIAFSACLLAFTAPAEDLRGEARDPAPPRITAAQDALAYAAVRAYHADDPRLAGRLLADLEELETAGRLPPLSRLLEVAFAGLRLQFDDFEDEAEEASLRDRMERAARAGRERCRATAGEPECLMIRGGILGFTALGKLDSHPPLEVLREGLEAVRLLEQALAADSSLTDACLGLGVFHAVAAGRTPRVVRALLASIGREVSVERGLGFLRRSGYEGQYTSVASQLYLARFLSPYDDESRREKAEIFRSLQETFPLSPRYLFLRGQEALAFHPDSFHRPETRAALERRLPRLEARDYAGERYLNLVRHQYTLLNPRASGFLAPDTTFDLGRYAFYPDFVRALRLHREIATGGSGDPSGDPRVRDLRDLEEGILARLRASGLGESNRRLYAWHVTDALRLRAPEPPPARRSGRAAGPEPGQDSAVITSNSAPNSRTPPAR